jgi:hypothetical protein
MSEAAATRSDPAAPETARAERDAAWRSPLLAAVLGLSLYLGVSGVWIWLDPRSRAGQMQVLVHTVAGLAALLPWARYQWIHLRRTWSKPLSHHLVLGWTSGTLLLACMATGVVVTWQAALGTRVSALWDSLHLATGLASFALVLTHALVVALRPRGGFATPESLRAWIRVSGAAALGVAIAAGAAHLVPTAEAQIPFPEGYRRPYGDSPFSPSLARTSTGGSTSRTSRVGSTPPTSW